MNLYKLQSIVQIYILTASYKRNTEHFFFNHFVHTYKFLSVAARRKLV